MVSGAPRSYDVLIDGAVRGRNRKDVWRTGEPLNAQAFEEPVAEFERIAVTLPATALPAPFAEPVTPSPVAESLMPGLVTESTAPSSEEKSAEERTTLLRNALLPLPQRECHWSRRTMSSQFFKCSRCQPTVVTRTW